MSHIYTQREALALEDDIGTSLDWVDVTTHGDRERMLLLISPRCAYCDRVAPNARCGGCGAGPSWTGGK
jgi:hypothetical protein